MLNDILIAFAIAVKTFLVFISFLSDLNFVGALFSRMHTTKKTAVKLKTDILNSLLRIFAMNGQTRTIFQEESGFVYVVAVLVSLEGSLADPAIGCWANGILTYSILTMIVIVSCSFTLF